ncbi:hypothetical protein ABT010_19400 [Streptomyces sp. NPDC002668]|uniref:hypothetical protein n=1 Tax=Streptomyces sp. NPDC002668 TaxID=3154422 RepID=UPI003326E0B6
MGIFSRNGRDSDRDVNADIEKAKREGSELLKVAHFHDNYENPRSGQATKNRRDTSGPSCESASTHQRGRRW